MYNKHTFLIELVTSVRKNMIFIYFLFVGLASTDGSSGNDDAAYHDVHTACDEAG